MIRWVAASNDDDGQGGLPVTTSNRSHRAGGDSSPWRYHDVKLGLVSKFTERPVGFEWSIDGGQCTRARLRHVSRTVGKRGKRSGAKGPGLWFLFVCTISSQFTHQDAVPF